MTINPTIPTVGSPRGSEEIDIVNALTAIVDAVNKGTGPALVASLPLAPVDGQEVYYLADAVNGVVWHLKYRAASPSAYKWEFVGGSPLVSEVTAVFNRNSGGTTYADADVGGAGPSVALPLVGDYMVTQEARFDRPASANQTIHMSYAIGGTAAVDADALSLTQNDAATPGPSAHLSRTRRKTGLGAVTLTTKYRVTGAFVGAGSDRSLSVVPVRVG
jgi:hypothetical protein